MKKVEDVFAKNKWLKKKIQQSIKLKKDSKDKNKKDDKPKDDDPDEGLSGGGLDVFTTRVAHTAFPTNVSSIRGSWIMDNGANGHVCNDTMKSRYKPLRSAKMMIMMMMMLNL
jgi:hypothetical protein